MNTKRNSLDDLQIISQFDKSQMGRTIEAFPQQLTQAWEELKSWKPNSDISGVTNIVTVGMGGSGLGAHFINSLYGDELKIPHVIVNDYNLSEFVDENSLVFLVSYSGTTEETLEAGKETLRREAKVIVMATGEKLAEFAKMHKIPAWIFEPKFNSCHPRTLLGISYLILGQILILKNLGLLEFSENNFQRILAVTQDASRKWRIEVKTEKNLAKNIASQIFEKIPVIFAAQFFQGNAHIMSNQINENAKMPAFWFTLPEANHHFLESIKSPLVKDNLVFVNLISQSYDDDVKKRFEITRELALQNMVKVIDISLESQIPFEESFSVLVLTSWISFYLAILDNIDPTPIPTVDYFKEHLKL